MTQQISIAVFGASGRMGRSILRLSADGNACVVAALVRADSKSVDSLALPESEQRESPLEFTAELSADVAPQVLIDFSGAAGFDDALKLALDRRIALVCGSTGLSEDQHAALAQAARKIPVLASANFSIAIALMSELVAQAAESLREWDCEIVETHHRHKKDAPSGTALALGAAIANARGTEFSTHSASPRTDPRNAGEIGFAAIRGGDVIGEHQVFFIGEGERIEITHRASNRDIFARGAIKAAIWLAGRPAGAYSLRDVLADLA